MKNKLKEYDKKINKMLVEKGKKYGNHSQNEYLLAGVMIKSARFSYLVKTGQKLQGDTLDDLIGYLKLLAIK